MEGSRVAKWYSGKKILITGSTGFMGKVLVEKLLRSCPEISKIYLLIRPKREKDPGQRITDDFLATPIFDNLRATTGIFDKLQVVQGDLSFPSLNLSTNDSKILEENVEIVFHLAANVKFDQSLRNAMIANTRGTKHVLDFSSDFLGKLIAFVHVSTTFCHCDQVELFEKIYPAPHDPRKLLDMVDWMEESMLDILTPHLIKNSPNTYAYTKCLTEQLVLSYEQKIPVAIARPSLVTAAMKEPIKGWIDNLNGPTGILVGAGKGVIRTMHCKAEFEAEIIPVDSAINSLIIIGYHLGNKPKTKLQVFHLTCDKENRISWGNVLNVGRKHVLENPFNVCLWYPSGSIKSSYFLHLLAVFFFHIIPAYLIDFFLVSTMNKPFLVRVQKKISKGLDVLQYYTTRPWYFHNEKMREISDSLSETDKEIFFINGPKDYDRYILDYILGARKYCVKEGPETLPSARKFLKKLYYLDLFKNIVLGALMIHVFGSYLISFLYKCQSFAEFQGMFQ